MNLTNNIVIRALSKLCDLMLLNIMWIICSIPIFTIGASSTAMYTVMLKVIKNEEGYIGKDFLKAFRENFRKSTILWMIIAALGGIVFLDFWLSRYFTVQIKVILQIIFLILGAVVLCMLIYAFPLTARYENSIKNTLKNALILSEAQLPYTALLLIINVGPILLMLLNLRNLFMGITIWLVIGAALVAWVNTIILSRTFEVLEQGGRSH